MSLIFGSDEEQEALNAQRRSEYDEHLDGDADGLGAYRGMLWAGGISLVIIGLLIAVFS